MSLNAHPRGSQDERRERKHQTLHALTRFPMHLHQTQQGALAHILYIYCSARKRQAAYLKWLEERARRKREYERFLAALAASRGARGHDDEQV